MGIVSADSLVAASNTACDLKIEEKQWPIELMNLLRDAGIDIPIGMDRQIIRGYERIEEKWRYARLNGCFSSSPDTRYEICWSLQGPLITGYSPEFFVPEDLTLVECVYHLTTAATTTGPTIQVYNGASSLDSEAMGTSATATVTGLSSAFTADSSKLRFQVSNLGDATARTLVCYARFQK